MQKNKGLSNNKLQDNGNKLIFENNVLCCQFLKDYIDFPIFQDLKPEDIEDVSDRFVPLFASERNADTVKRIQIKENTPFFLISLIEHKSYVEYNIHMQIFRYMVYIWENYEKESEQQQKGLTKKKSFRYPPILPIIYYEGKQEWTAPLAFKEKILFGEMFEKYLPNFTYYMVPLHKFSNETLLAHEDEISLVMLINKMQTQEDINLFRKLPSEQLNAILKDSPDFLVELIAKVMRAFLLKENVPIDETEELVGKIKERRMGQLFENMDKMDIQAERRKTAEAMKKVETANKKAEAERENGIQALVEACKELNATREYVINKITSKYQLSEAEAEQKVNQYQK